MHPGWFYGAGTSSPLGSCAATCRNAWPPKRAKPGMAPGLRLVQGPETGAATDRQFRWWVRVSFWGGICEVYYGDLSGGDRRPSQQFAKQPALAVRKRLQFAEERSNLRCAGVAKIDSCQCTASLDLRVCSELHLNGPVHKSSWSFSFINGRQRPVPSSIDIADFAPCPAKEQYPRGEQPMHSP